MTTATTDTHYIVQESAANPAGRKWGHFRRVAVLEVHADCERASMISERSRDVLRIVKTWEDLDGRGTTPRSAYQQALAEAEALAAELNGGE